MTYKGLDVSNVPSYQRNITLSTWKKIKADGYSFVILKAGGSDDDFYKDAVFEKNYKNAKAAGLNVGAYYVVGGDFVSEERGKQAAQKFIDILKDKQFEYPVYLDIESSYFSPKSKKYTTDACVAFIKTLQNAGYWAGIYASTVSGYQNVLDDSRLQPYAHWVAEYNGEDKCSYKGKVGTGIWQYTSSGNVTGINGYTDLDISYVDYPTKIKAKGLNGFEKSKATSTTTKKETEASLRSAMVSLANSYVGCVRGDAKHKEIIDIFNTVKPDGWAMNYTAAWCATFVSALAIKMFGKEKANLYFPLSANCYNIIYKKSAGAMAKGIWVENDAYIPSPGDWIIYDWDDNGVGDDKTGYDHVGIVKSVSNGTITVIEGNMSNKCGVRTMRVNGRYIRGFVHIKYNELAGGVAATKPTAIRVNVDGVWGRYTTKALRVKLGLPESDGIVRNQVTSCKKRLMAIDATYWMFASNPKEGDPAIEALQKRIGDVYIDGWIGEKTITALQKYLNRNLGINLYVDGYCGVQTVKALQRWINK